jgi:outer membrane receptor protein involved in Fe transport
VVSIQQGFRNPTPEDPNATVTNLAFDCQTIPDPELQNEISQSFEIGLRGNFEKRSWSFAGFYNHYEDFIKVSKRMDAAAHGTGFVMNSRARSLSQSHPP